MMTIAFPTLGVQEVITSHAATARTALTVGALSGAVPVREGDDVKLRDGQLALVEP